jgi:predicted permease
MQSQLLARRRELAIRQSLGAGRSRLFREWIAESAALSLMGGALGLLVAAVTAAVIANIQLPVQLVGDLRFAARMDARVVGYAFLLCAIATLLFGVAPAWRASRQPVTPVLKDDGGAVAGGRASVRFRRVAVFVQVAVSVVLLLLAAVIARGLASQLSADPGFPTQTLGLMSVNPRQMRIAPGEYRAIADRVLETVRADSAVTAVDLATNVALGFGQDRIQFNIPGYTGGRNGSSRISIDYNIVGSDYFRAVGIPFVGGGTWPASPANPKTPPLVINETMARRMFPDKNAVGLPLEVVGQGSGTIVGVVRDIKYYDLSGPAIPYVYFPAEAQMPGEYTLHIRTTGDPAPVLARLSRALAAADHRLATFDVMTFEALRRVPLFPARALMTSAMAFGLIALALTAVGLYGVVATSVGQRTREIGVRMALGARPSMVLGGVLRESLTIVGIGAVAGLALGYFAIGALRSSMSEIGSMDVTTAAGVAGLLAASAILAAWIPARRAAAIDPVRALRM